MLLLSTRITEALNKGHKSYYALPFQLPCKENISETPILFSLRFSTYPVWFHSRNFANSSLVQTRELLAKLATGRIIPRQTGLEENFHDLGIIATNYNVRVVKLATLTSTFFRSIFGNTEPSIIWKNVPKLLWN